MNGFYHRAAQSKLNGLSSGLLPEVVAGEAPNSRKLTNGRHRKSINLAVGDGQCVPLTGVGQIAARGTMNAFANGRFWP